jgi:pantoate kinase
MKAFAPASVTALFAPAESGSVGVSVALADGVTAEVAPAEESVVRVDGEPASFEPVANVLDALGVTAAVDLAADVPIGCGFGASGAATLATALAAAERFDLGHSRDDLVGAAHEAEVAAGTGLGDVFVQEMGGLVVGDEDGRRRFERDVRVEYESWGGISTADVLGDDDLMARAEREGRRLLADLPAEPSLADVATRGWTFTQALDVATPRVADAVARVDHVGGAASMAMVGESVFAVGADGALDERTEVDHGGARLT